MRSLAVYSEQLSCASLIDIAKAEAAMLEGLLRSSKTSEQILEAAKFACMAPRRRTAATGKQMARFRGSFFMQ